MNNCHLLNVYKHVRTPHDNAGYDLDDFQDSYDANYIYYQCYVDDENHFCYFETSPNSVTQYSKSAVYKISKNIPTFFHKTLLYFKYIPKFF
jgi:hypothetical protein